MLLFCTWYWFGRSEKFSPRDAPICKEVRHTQQWFSRRLQTLSRARNIAWLYMGSVVSSPAKRARGVVEVSPSSHRAALGKTNAHPRDSFRVHSTLERLRDIRLQPFIQKTSYVLIGTLQALSCFHDAIERASNLAWCARYIHEAGAVLRSDNTFGRVWCLELETAVWR